MPRSAPEVELAAREVFSEAYEKAKSGDDAADSLDDETLEHLSVATSRIGSRKAVFQNLINLCILKIVHPDQDIRNHQSSMESTGEGISARTFDTNITCPLLREYGLPHMAESAQTTRSLEQPFPYDKDYPGRIHPPELKNAFLCLVDAIQFKEGYPELILQNLLEAGIRYAQENSRPLISLPETHLSAYKVCRIIEEHCTREYGVRGGSKLPVLAVAALWETIVDEFKRYENCKVLPVQSHTSSDKKSQKAGDVEIVGDFNEAAEIKLGISITPDLIRRVAPKAAGQNRYYVLSTARPGSPSNSKEIQSLVQEVYTTTGCEIIVGNVFDYLFHLLNTVRDPRIVLQKYKEAVEKDQELSPIHKTVLEELLQESEVNPEVSEANTGNLMVA